MAPKAPHPAFGYILPASGEKEILTPPPRFLHLADRAEIQPRLMGVGEFPDLVRVDIGDDEAAKELRGQRVLARAHPPQVLRSAS